MSINDAEKFWGKAAAAIHWFEEPRTVLAKDTEYFYRWFPDGIMNTCHNCLDVHVDGGRGEQVAVYYDSPMTDTKRRYTYRQLLDEVSKLAGGLRDDLGVRVGDRVVIYMPMIPEAVVAMLACARIGAVHSVVFGGFAAPELASRIVDCRPKVVVSASAGIEPTRVVPYKPLLDRALEIAEEKSCHTIEKVVVFQRRNVRECEMKAGRDIDFEDLVSKSSPVDAIPVPANHPHYVLYTSGTTGIPKGIVRDTAGYAVALKYSVGAFYNCRPGDTFFTASDIGWVVGHSYSVYGPLLNGSSTVLYEGKPVGTPDAGAFWRIIEEYGVRTLFAAPTAFRAIKQSDPHAELARGYDLSSLDALFLAGEHSDPDTLHFCQLALDGYGGDVGSAIDHWWQTELGHPGVGNAVGLGRMPLRPGGCTAPAPGYDVRIVDEETGREVQPGDLGDMVIKMPLPPGTLTTLYNNDDRYIEDYLKRYPGYYDTGDAAFQDEEGYIHIMGRTDDLINVAGHRLSTGGLEEVLQSHEQVADCAVVPVKDPLKGQIPVGFVVTNADCTMDDDQLKAELVQLVRDSVGPVANFKKVALVKALPKTRSGKILRGTMSKIANGEPYTVTPTVEDPNIFDYLEPVIQELVGRQ